MFSKKAFSISLGLLVAIILTLTFLFAVITLLMETGGAGPFERIIGNITNS